MCSKSGGRYAIVVWDEPARNAYIGLLNRAAGPVFNAPPPPPDSPGAFRFAQPGRSNGWFVLAASPMSRWRACRWFSIAVRWRIICASPSIPRSGLKAKLNALRAEDRARFEALVREGAKDHMDEGRLRLPATVLAPAVALKRERLTTTCGGTGRRPLSHVRRVSSGTFSRDANSSWRRSAACRSSRRTFIAPARCHRVTAR